MRSESIYLEAQEKPQEHSLKFVSNFNGPGQPKALLPMEGKRAFSILKLKQIFMNYRFVFWMLDSLIDEGEPFKLPP